MLTKLIIRFFIICVFFTIIISLAMLYLYQKLDEKDTLDNFKLMTGIFNTLDETLKKYPVYEWQRKINAMQPKDASEIYIIPINKLELNKKQLEKIKNKEIIYTRNKKENYENIIIYKLSANPAYVYQEFIDFNPTDIAHRVFGLTQAIIIADLKLISKNKWPEYFKNLSAQYGFPIMIVSTNEINISYRQKQKLLNHHWVVDLPKQKNDSIQILYAPIPDSNHVIKYGPILLPFIGVNLIYILSVSTFILIEFIIFILVMLFANTLEKLNLLAEEYGQGNFDNTKKISKASTLYPLFINLKKMGTQVNNLIYSHKHLINSVSHELRTPLSRLKFSLELLKESNDIKQVAVRVNSMEDDIKELEELVAEILTYSQLDREPALIELESVKLGDIISRAVEYFQKNMLNKKLLLSIPNDCYDQIITVNQKYVLRALHNLLQNANKFAKTTIKLSVTHHEITIEDDGRGISEEDKNQVFQPFVQLSNQPDDFNKSGYGLGLAITKKIIEQHHWKIRIDNSKLGGTKMVILYTSYT